MKTEYAECPFCGNSHITGRMATINEWPNYFVICCDDCGAVMTFFNEKDQSIGDIINHYNKRVWI